MRLRVLKMLLRVMQLYSRASDGQVGKAIANDTFDKACVAGVAETTKTAGQSVKVIVAGIVATSGLNTGDQYFLSAASAGAIVETPPSSAGQYVTRVEKLEVLDNS